jgi:hypothetical protein
MIYLMQGGGFVIADTADQFACRMRKSSRTPSQNVPEFMRQVSDRAWLYNQSSIRFDTADNFLQDLIASEIVVSI